MSPAAEQLRHLRSDIERAVNGRWWRWFVVPLAPGILSIVGYRLSRASYLRMGEPYRVLHAAMAPFRLLLRPFGAGLEIHYTAAIGPGMKVLHPNLGVVVSGDTVIGSRLTLTGGNCIGHGAGLTLGEGVDLGANAVILGPGVVGDHVVLGAGAVLIGDAPAGATMVGAPAKPVVRNRP